LRSRITKVFVRLFLAYMVDSPLTCSLRLTVLPKEDTLEASKTICCEGLDQSPILTVEPHESSTWSTEIILLVCGNIGVGAIVEEKSKVGLRGHGRRWISNICCMERVDCLSVIGN
jgi:hypothetical protein